MPRFLLVSDGILSGIGKEARMQHNVRCFGIIEENKKELPISFCMKCQKNKRVYEVNENSQHKAKDSSH
jgi:hypothetical protein